MSFWDTITKAVSSIPVPSITPATPKKPEPVLQARIGEGMTPEETAKANEIVRNPDTAMNTAKDNTFWEKTKKAVVNEFTPQEQEVRTLFSIEPKTQTTLPIVNQLGSFGFRLIEAIPRAIATVGGEIAGGGKPNSVNIGIDARRLGFDTPEYQTASKEQTDAINNGENPWISGLRIVSSKTLDVAFGASLISDLSKISTQVLVGGGVESRIEAQNIVDAYKVNAKEAFARLKNAPLAEREKAMADLVNMKNQAEKVLRETGKPTALDMARSTASRYTDVLSRQTPITKNFWGDIMNPDLGVKAPVTNAPRLNVPQLGGTREVPNQAPAMGLSLKKIETVGGDTVPESLNPIAQKAQSMTEDNFTRLFNEGLIAQNLTVRQTAENILAEMKKSGFKDPQDFYKSIVPDTPKQNSIFQEQAKQELFKTETNQTPEKTQAFDELTNISEKVTSLEDLYKKISEKEIPNLEDVVQFHGSQNKDIAEAFKTGTIKVSEDGVIGKGFYVTGTPELADYFGKQIKLATGGRGMTSNVPDIYAVDLRDLNIKKLPYGKQDYYDFLDKKGIDANTYNDQLQAEGYDGLNLEGRGETIIFDPKKVKIMDLNTLVKPPKKQSELVKEAISTTPKSIKQIAKETKVLEPNVRRILGVGAKEGTFERIDKGVYVLSKDGEDMAWIETGDAMESLARLAKDGMKADMVFLDIPYDTPAIKGGSRGMNYNLISVADFGKVLDSVKVIARKENSPVIHMFSQAPSGMTAMQKYNDLFLEKGFKPVGRGELQKTFKDGSPVTNVRGVVSKPEGILVFSKSGELDKELKNLNFKLVRPKGYQSEKPAEMLKQMIEMTTEEGDVVLDPFAGSGVTGAEAIKAGRKAHLIEKDQTVVDNFIKPRIQEALNGLKNDIPLQTAIDAHRGTSFYPEKRGEQRIQDYVDSMTNDYEELSKLATDEEKKALLETEFAKLREGFKSRKIALMNAEARTISPMITGAGNFPVARNRARMDIVSKRRGELLDYEEYMMKKIKNELNPTTFVGTSEKVIGQMNDKLAELKATQEKMKLSNKIIQSGKNVEEELNKLWSPATTKTLMEGDYAGRKGFASYQLTSINNRIKTLEKRATETTTKREIANTTGDQVQKIGDATIVKNFDQNRLQVMFDGIPSLEVRASLKTRGFRWSPTNKAWQRILTDQAEKDAQKILGELKTPEVPKVPEEVHYPKSLKTPASSEEASIRYYDDVLKPKIDNGEALVIGADDLKYHFGDDFDPNHHAMYSGATNALYEKLVKEIENPMVHFSVGGTGSGKSDFIIPDLSNNFNGIIYDSTGWNYEGIKKQIQFAYDNGKSVELYGIIPDIEKARAYTFKREAEGKHPVSETSFVRTHVGAIDTMIKLIDDGADVYTLDTQGKSIEEIAKHDYQLNQIDTLRGLGYNEVYVKEQANKVTGSNYQEVISKGQDSSQGIPQESGSTGEITPDNIPERVSTIDRLISENKIRVVSRNGRDVYQYQRGKEWVNARDEDSAIKQVTKPTPEKKIQVLPKNLEDAKTYLSIVKDTLDLNPAKQLEKYYDPKLGGLPEVGTVKSIAMGGRKNVSKWRTDGDQIASELGYEDSETAREEFDRYLQNKKEYHSDMKAFVKDRNDYIANEKAKPKVKIPLEVPKEVPQIDTQTGEGRSLEIQGQQSLNKVDEPFRDKVSSLPKIIEQSQTPVKEKINLLDYLRTPDKVLEKIGFGKESKMLRNGYEEYLKELPKNIQKITDWSKRVSSTGNLDIFKWLDGEAITLKPEDQIVATEIKSWLKEWASRLGLPDDKQITHYITHLFDSELVNKEFDEDLAKIIAEKIPSQVYDPFLISRLGAKGYKQDTWQALDAYVKRATRKVHMDPALEAIKDKAGSSLEYSNIEESKFRFIQRYINGVNMRPTEIDNLLDNTIKSIIGYKYGQRPVTYITKTLRQMTFRGMLGGNLGSAMRNISQGINTFAVLGPKYTAIGYANLFNPSSYAELEREGVLNVGFIQDRALSSSRKMMEKVDKVLFAFFDTAEKINRGSAYFGAKAMYIAEHTKVLGPDLSIVSSANLEQDAIEYAKKIVRQTQFAFGSIDTPVALQSDIIKTLSQFQTFTIKQIEFLGEMAKDKNWWGLIRYAVAGMAFVYTIGKAFGMKPEELIPSFRFGIPPSLKFPTEVGKAVFNTPDKYNQPRDWSKKLSDIGTSMIGLIPAGSQIKKTLQGIDTVNNGGSFDKGGNLQFSQGQTLTEKTQSVLFGKYASNEAQNYFNKSEINSAEMKKIEPVYTQVQDLANAGKKDEALAIVNGLSDAEYAMYKKYKTAKTAEATVQGKKDILPKFLEIQKVNKTNPSQAQEMLNSLSDDEYKYYKLVKNQIAKDQLASEGETPTYSNNEAQTEQGLIGTVTTYAKALAIDPVTAFNRIFTGQRIRRVDSGAIIVERMTLQASEGVKTARGATEGMKLDHTIPLELGGSNSDDNLKLVDTDTWSSYTPVENYLGKKLQDGTMNRKEVQDLITRFKNGEITTDDVYNQ